MSKEKKAMLQMLLLSMMWSIAGIFIKLISWNAMVIAGFRSLFAGITVLIYMLIAKKKFKVTKKALISMIFLCLTFLSFVLSNKLTTAANAIVLQFTSAVFIMLFGIVFRKEKYSALDIITVILTLGGIFLFVLDGLKAGNILGNMVGLMTGIFMASMFISVGDCEDDEKFTGILFGQFLTAVVGLSFVFFYPPEVDFRQMSFVLILGVIQLGIPYVLLGFASKHCPPLALSLIAAAEPLLNPVWVAIFAHEYPSKISLLGGIIVIVTISAWCILKDKKNEQKNSHS